MQWSVPGCPFFDSAKNNFESNLVLVVVLVLESKGHNYDDRHHLYLSYGYNSTRSDWLLSGQDFLVMTGHYLCPRHVRSVFNLIVDIYIIVNKQLWKRYPLISVTWLYRGLNCKSSADQSLVLIDRWLRYKISHCQRNFDHIAKFISIDWTRLRMTSCWRMLKITSGFFYSIHFKNNSKVAIK